MLIPHTQKSINPLRTAICKNAHSQERVLLNLLLPLARLPERAQSRVHNTALKYTQLLRANTANTTLVQDLLNEYALSTQEGVVLMCLAEALLRVPDKATANLLIRDKLMKGNWRSHLGNDVSLFVNASAWGLLICGKLVNCGHENKQSKLNLLQKITSRLSETVIRTAMYQAIRMMGSQFILGHSIEDALNNAKQEEAKGYRYSYDMLGEAARTMSDADSHYQAYYDAIKQIGELTQDRDPISGAGISVKLSALHPRYEFSQSERIHTELLPRLKSLAILAKKFNIGLTVDAEDANRLNLYLEIIEEVFLDKDLDGWEGFGVAVQSYLKSAIVIIYWITDLCRTAQRKMMVRLVKGAYWDTEIKRSQVDGLDAYPVFTRKASTDVSFQACAKRMLENRDFIYPQFATHNAYSVAYILEIAGNQEGFEFQRLHGMGEGLFDALLQENRIPCRIYAPVGKHENLLAYLVRRLLENGANTSFVNNIADRSIAIENLIEDPVAKVRGWADVTNPHIPLPKDLYNGERINSKGIDLTDTPTLIALEKNINRWCEAQLMQSAKRLSPAISTSINPADYREIVARIPLTPVIELDNYLTLATRAFKDWSNTGVQARALCLQNLADALENRQDQFIAICIKEAGKTVQDAIAELREAIDFCRYYAAQACKLDSAIKTWGEYGKLEPRGVILCISPWNFPLAIFLGQVSAALAAGNTVIAKPAESTRYIAQFTIELLDECGFPRDVVQLANCSGGDIAEHLLPDERIAGVMFTGSTQVGTIISRILANRPGARAPLIAETGGQNCMVVDSTSLPEQVVDDVIASGFQSAGQRCSALRVLFLQEDIADRIIQMIIGAMQELRVGNPDKLSTDVGPLINAQALATLNTHIDAMQGKARLLYACELHDECDHGFFFAPHLYEIDNIGLLKEEVFGPIVHVIRYPAGALEQVFDAINSTGFGLTAGIHTRIQSNSNRAAAAINAGNIYINRNMIGAVVGTQPFGGHGLSGTGPKAGGPAYLLRLLKQPDTGANRSSLFDSEESPPVLAKPHAQSRMIREMVQATRLWSEVPVKQRAERVTLLATSLQRSDKLSSALFDQIKLSSAQAIAQQHAPVIMPGPTGELNQLYSEPRGVLVILTHGKTGFATAIKQIASALLTGNGVIHGLIDHDDSWQLKRFMENAGLASSYHQVRLNNQPMLEALILSEEIAGVAVSDPGAMARQIDTLLTRRQGALIPLIIESAGPALLQRFIIEQVVSTNTTAAGGNASLITLGDRY